MVVFFIYIALSVSFEGYSANCALIYTIYSCSNVVLLLQNVHFNGIFPPKKHLQEDFVPQTPYRGSTPGSRWGQLPPDPFIMLPGKL